MDTGFHRYDEQEATFLLCRNNPGQQRNFTGTKDKKSKTARHNESEQAVDFRYRGRLGKAKSGEKAQFMYNK